MSPTIDLQLNEQFVPFSCELPPRLSVWKSSSEPPNVVKTSSYRMKENILEATYLVFDGGYAGHVVLVLILVLVI